MKKRSKRYREGLGVLAGVELPNVDRAMDLLRRVPNVKFDETVALAARLGVDPKQSDQMVRGVVALPHGSGRHVRVLAFTESPQAALDAGAEFAGLADLIVKIQGGWCDFDVAIATPSAMKEVRSVARVLGPRGLMPNPKSGTVSDDVVATIAEVRAGRVEFKMDKTANLAIVIGRRSFSATQLIENFNEAVQCLLRACPPSFKGRFLRSISVSLTMSPSISLSLKSFSLVD